MKLSAGSARRLDEVLEAAERYGYTVTQEDTGYGTKVVTASMKRQGQRRDNYLRIEIRVNPQTGRDNWEADGTAPSHDGAVPVRNIPGWLRRHRPL